VADPKFLAAVLEDIAGSVFERMLLVRRVIGESRIHTPGVSGVANSLESVAVATETRTNWSNLSKIYRRLKSSASASPEIDFDSALNILGTAAKETLRLNQYLSLLPTREAPKALLTSIELSYPKQFTDISPTVLLLPDLTYYEFDLTTWLKNDVIFSKFTIPISTGDKVIRLSMSEMASPMQWPITMHEFGHAIADHEKLLEKVGLNKPKDVLESTIANHFGEFFADGVAAISCGPSMLLALIRFELLLIAQGRIPFSSGSHPSTRARADFVRQLIGNDVFKPFQRSITTFEGLSDYLISTVPGAAQGEKDFETLVFSDARNKAKVEIQGLGLSSFDKACVDRSERLADRIGRDVPPSAIRQVGKASIRPSLLSAIEDKDTKRFKDAIRCLSERPATPGEVFYSGHLIQEKELPAQVEAVLSQDPASIKWDEWIRPIKLFFEKNSLLLCALNAAEVHSQLESAARKQGESLSSATSPAGSSQKSPPEGAVLSDAAIAVRLVHAEEDKRLYVTPLIDAVTQLGPSSLDLRLGSDALVITNVNMLGLDPLQPEQETLDAIADYTREISITRDSPLILHPGEFALAASLEYVKIPKDLACRLEGRSSYGRGGLLIHATAGFVDPGYAGRITFELTNLGKAPVSLYPGTRIGQLCFFPVLDVIRPYLAKEDKKYVQALKTLASRFFQDLELKWLRKTN
jgi:dCTP deaminase